MPFKVGEKITYAVGANEVPGTISAILKDKTGANPRLLSPLPLRCLHHRTCQG